MEKQIWIGLITVNYLKKNGIIKKNQEAFTNALTYAFDKLEYKKNVQESMKKLGLKVTCFESIEPWRTRIKKHTLSDDIVKKAKRLKINDVQYSTFHFYDVT